MSLNGSPGFTTLVATGGDDETVRPWDPATGTAVGDPTTDQRYAGPRSTRVR
jgi:hypothetical protein